MFHKMFQAISITGIVLVALLTRLGSLEVRCDEIEPQSIKRVYSDNVDEGSCICGLNKDILDRLEVIVKKTNTQHCLLGSKTPFQEDVLATQTSNPPAPVQDPQQVVAQGSRIEPQNQISAQGGTNGSPSGTNDGDLTDNRSDENQSLVSKLNHEIQALQAHLASLRPSTNSNLQQQESSTQAPANLISTSPSFVTNLNPMSQVSGSSNSHNNGQPQLGSSILSGLTNWGLPNSLISGQISLQLPNNNINVQHQTTSRPSYDQPQQQQPSSHQSPQHIQNQGSTNSGFLQGLPPSSNEASANQNHKVEPQEVQEAVVSTVPNVVSNIFTNIQDFAIQTEHNPDEGTGLSPSANQLTSIDGSSAQLHKNDTAAQITAQGEQLFLQWIEHQIQTYHMTASMAAYIRKSALNLFRKIVKQYVQRIERVGGAVENNVRQATQLALNNTQNLISFLLRNYLNFAGGLMQIIGEQVSRVGKQLDSTGDTIAHINLNPFDIVSNVIDSLPNPSRYSEYFRAFGKYLMGESSLNNNSNNDSNNNNNYNQGQQQLEDHEQQQGQEQEKRKGLFSKTMGALGKTLGSWLG